MDIDGELCVECVLRDLCAAAAKVGVRWCPGAAMDPARGVNACKSGDKDGLVNNLFF